MFLCAVGKSFRTSKDTDMIRFGADRSIIDLVYNKDLGDMDINIIINKDHKKIVKIDGIKIKKTSFEVFLLLLIKCRWCSKSIN